MIRVRVVPKILIWLVVKLPGSRLRDQAIAWLLNRLVEIKSEHGWQRVTGVKFGNT